MCQRAVFGLSERVLGFFQGLARSVGVGKLLIGRRLGGDAGDEVAQSLAEGGQVAGDGQGAVHLHHDGGQAFDGRGGDERGVILGHVGGQVLRELLPTSDRGAALGTGLVPKAVRVGGSAVAGGE